MFFKIFNWKCEIKTGNSSRVCAIKHTLHWVSYDFDSSMQIYSGVFSQKSFVNYGQPTKVHELKVFTEMKSQETSFLQVVHW